MAKSGQKRAFEDEAIQATPPKEELRVSERQPVDLRYNIDAEYNRNGRFLNPELFNSLAEISDAVHDTRRYSRMLDFQLDRQNLQTERATLEKQYEQQLKNQADLNVFDGKMQILNTYDTAEREARQRGELYSEKLPGLQEQVNKYIENTTADSPYAQEQLTNYAEQQYISAFGKASTQDEKLQENKALFRMGEYIDIVSNQIVSGSMSLDAAIDGIPTMVTPLAVVGHMDAAKTINSAYNAFIQKRAEWIAGQVALNNTNPNAGLTVDEGQSMLSQLLVQYKKSNISGYRDPDQTEKQDYEVWLTTGTVDTITKLKAGLEKKKPKLSSSVIRSDYLELIDYDTWKNGKDFDKSPYLRSRTQEQMVADFLPQYKKLKEAEAQGDENAAKYSSEMFKGFMRAYRVRGMCEAVNQNSIDKGNTQAGLDWLANTSDKLLADLDKGPGAQFDNAPSYLTYDNGTTMINLGFPVNSDLSEMLMQNGGQDKRTVQYNYYKGLYDDIKAVLAAGADADVVSMIDPDYAQFANKLDNFSPQSLVTTDAKGHVTTNNDGVTKLGQLMKEGLVVGNKANNGAYMNSMPSSFIESLAKKISTFTPETKAVAIMAYAQACLNVGNYGGIVEAQLSSNLSAEARDLIEQASVYALVGATPNSSNKIYNIGQLNISKTYPNPNMATAAAEMKKHGWAGFDKEAEDAMAKYQVPAEFKPGLRKAFAQAALADLEAHRERDDFDKYKPAHTIIDDILKANFKGGAYVHSAALQGTNIDSFVESSDKAKKDTKSVLQKLGVNAGDVTTKINYRSRSEEIYVNGAPLVEVADKNSSVGTKPFQLYMDTKPKDMDEGKYNRAHTATLTGATILSAITGADSNPQIQKVLDKYSKGMKADDAQSLAYQMLSFLNTREGQKAWYEYYNSNFRNTQVLQAPKEFKSITVDLLKTAGFMTFNPLRDRREEAITKDQASAFVDFLYTKLSNKKTAPLDIPSSLYVQGKGINLTSFNDLVINSGMQLTSIDTGTHAPGSKHFKHLALDIGFPGGYHSVLDASGHIPAARMDRFLNKQFLDLVKQGAITRIAVGAELASYLCAGGSDQSKAYAKYRAMKNAKGESLFVHYPEEDGNTPHFHVELAEKWQGGKPPSTTEVSPNYSANVANVIKTNVDGIYTMADARACAKRGVHYTATDEDAKRMGRPKATLNSNPAYRAQAYANKYANYKSTFGSSNNAVAAMAGCRFVIVNKKAYASGGVLPQVIAGVSSEEGRLISSSIKIPINEPMPADTLMKYLKAFPYNSLTYRVYYKDSDKMNNALKAWIQDGK